MPSPLHRLLFQRVAALEVVATTPWSSTCGIMVARLGEARAAGGRKHAGSRRSEAICKWLAAKGARRMAGGRATVTQRSATYGHNRTDLDAKTRSRFLGLRHRVVSATSVYPNQHLDRFSRLWSMRTRNQMSQSKPHSFIPLACATTTCVDKENMTKNATKELKNSTADDTDKNSTENSTADNIDADDVHDMLFPFIYENSSQRIWEPYIYNNSSHRDGAIYTNRSIQEEWFGVDITDHEETRIEPMITSKATRLCLPDPEKCMVHFPTDMLQFFSLTLAENFISNGSIQLYGYISVRDDIDYMRNYVFNHSRDEAITVQEGSLIQMTGPKRSIAMVQPALIEFDMRIKNGEHEEYDLPLIDGATACRDRSPYKPIMHRITGPCGAVDLSFAFVPLAVEATIEVVISELQRGFSFSLTSLVYVMDDTGDGFSEIQLFHGFIDESCVLRRFVVAVTWETEMFLRFKVGNNNVEHYRSFKVKKHGCAGQQIKLEDASFSVKVTWSTC